MPSTVDFPTTGLTPNVTTYTLGTRTWLWNGAAWEIVAQTATGYTGSLGYTGSVGYTGSAGTNGYTGSVGVGYTGSTGYTGSAGTNGSTGYTGSQGPIGYTGSPAAGGSGPFAACNTKNIVTPMTISSSFIYII